MSDKAPFFVYMLRCGDGSLYTGYTNDVNKRVSTHAQGRGAKYTRAHLPIHLAGCWPCADKHQALRCEAAIKKLSRSKKEELLQKTKGEMPSLFNWLFPPDQADV